MIAVESVANRPLPRSTVRIVTIPSPLNWTGRRISSQRATGTVYRRRVSSEWKLRAGTHERAAPACAGYAIAAGVDSITNRAEEPFWRASTKLPSTVIVRVIAIFAGSLTSTSVSFTLAKQWLREHGDLLETDF